MEHKCDKCRGKGVRLRKSQDINGKKLEQEEVCRQCHGSGVCGVCNGSGAISGHAFSAVGDLSVPAVVVVEASCPGRSGIR